MTREELLESLPTFATREDIVDAVLRYVVAYVDAEWRDYLDRGARVDAGALWPVLRDLSDLAGVQTPPQGPTAAWDSA